MEYYKAIMTSRRKKIWKKQDGIALQYECVMIENVLKDGVPFRDHVWIKDAKRLNDICSGDVFTFTARIQEYANGKKSGLRHIRNVSKAAA